MLKDFLMVGLGGAIGSMLRYGTNLAINSKIFPTGTLLVNLIGCFAIGLFFGISIKNENLAANWKLFFATGLCGGFTTFSAFSLENMQLLISGKYGLFALYIIASILLGLAAVVAGYRLIH